MRLAQDALASAGVGAGAGPLQLGDPHNCSREAAYATAASSAPSWGRRSCTRRRHGSAAAAGPVSLKEFAPASRCSPGRGSPPARCRRSGRCGARACSPSWSPATRAAVRTAYPRSPPDGVWHDHVHPRPVGIIASVNGRPTIRRPARPSSSVRRRDRRGAAATVRTRRPRRTPPSLPSDDRTSAATLRSAPDNSPVRSCDSCTVTAHGSHGEGPGAPVDEGGNGARAQYRQLHTAQPGCRWTGVTAPGRVCRDRVAGAVPRTAARHAWLFRHRTAIGPAE